MFLLEDIRKEEAEKKKKDDAANAAKKQAEQKVIQQNTQQNVDKYYNENISLAKKITGISDDNPFYQSTDKINQIVNDSLYKDKYSRAAASYKAKYKKEGTQQDIEKYIADNRLQIEKDLYGSLTQSALKSNIDFNKKGLYESYVGENLKKSTPKEQKTDWGKQALEVGKSLFDTVAGIGTASYDAFAGTNTYGQWFGDRTTLKANAGFTSKIMDTMTSQGGIIDLVIGLGTLATGGFGAPALLSLKTLGGAGLKTLGKGVIKNLTKEGLEKGTEFLAKEFTLHGLEEGAAKEFGNKLISSLGKGTTKEVLEDIVKQTGKGSADIIESITKSLGLATEGMEGKALKKATAQIDRLGLDLGTKTLGEKIATSSLKENITDLGDTLADMLGIPGTSAVRLTVDSAGKFKLKSSLVGGMMDIGLPASTLIPAGIGDWISQNVLSIGQKGTNYYTQQTKSGLYAIEAKKFEDQYGINPIGATGQLKQNWENYINYKLKYATPSEAITGTANKDRSEVGQWVTGTIDTMVNFIPMAFGLHAIGKTYGIASEKLSPISADGTSNINFIRALEEIQSTIKDPIEKGKAIEELKNNQQITTGTTIKSMKDLRNTIEEFVNLGGLNDTRLAEFKEIGSLYKDEMVRGMKEFEKGNQREGLEIISNAGKEMGTNAEYLFSSEKIKNMAEKVDVFNSYFEKVNEAGNFLSKMSIEFGQDFIFRSLKDPSIGIVNNYGNLGRIFANKIGDAALNREKITDTYRKIGELTNELGGTKVLGETPQSKIIKDKIRDSLKSQGFTSEDSEVIMNAVYGKISREIIKTYISLDKYSTSDVNLGKVFDDIFGNFGVNIKEVSEKNVRGTEKTIVDLLRGNSTMEYRVLKKELNANTKNLLQDEITKSLKSQDKSKELISIYSKQLEQINKLHSDLANKLHYQKELEKNANTFKDTTELKNKDDVLKDLQNQINEIKDYLTNPDLPKRIKEEGQEKIDNISSTIETIKKIPDEKIKQDTNIDVMTEDEIRNSSELNDFMNSEIGQNNIRYALVKNKEEFNTYITKVKQESEKLASKVKMAIKQQSRTIIRSLGEMQVSKGNVEENKYQDSFFASGKKIQSETDAINKSIVNYGLIARDYFNQYGLSKQSLVNFDKQYKTRLNKLYGDVVLKKIDKLKDAEGNIKQIENGYNILMKKITDQYSKPIDTEFFYNQAKKFDTKEEFKKSIINEIKDRYGFDESFGIEFAENLFGKNDEKLSRTYNLYKKSFKINKANVYFDENEGIIFSNGDVIDERAATEFLDENGNIENHIRTEGIMQNKVLNLGYKENDIVFLNEIYDEKGEKIDTSILNKKSKDGEKNSREKYTDFFNKAIDKMNEQGYTFIGSFQEEGKKTIFIKRKEGVSDDDTRAEVISTLMGMDKETYFNEYNKNPKSFLQKQQKRLKLSLWAEINPDKEIFESGMQSDLRRQNTQDRKLVLYFNDKNEYGEKKYDGNSFSLGHYVDILNKTIGVSKDNIIHKTVGILGNGGFQKHASIKLFGDFLSDDSIKDAINIFANNEQENGLLNFINKQAQKKGLTLDNWNIDGEIRNKVLGYIDANKIIDEISPASTIKDITSIKREVGSIIEIPRENIGMKMNDYSSGNLELYLERIKMPNNSMRNFLDLFSTKGNSQQIIDVINKRKKDRFQQILDLVNGNSFNPKQIISDIEELFGEKYVSHLGEDFFTENNKYNINNFLSNIFKKEVLNGVSYRGNQCHYVPLPNVDKITDVINEKLRKVPGYLDGNFVLLDRSSYEFLTNKDKYGNPPRVMIGRNPLTSPSNIAYPFVVFTDEVGLNNTNLGGGIASSSKMRQFMSGDFDGDKIFMIHDQDLLSHIGTNLKLQTDNVWTAKGDDGKYIYGEENTDTENKDIKGNNLKDIMVNLSVGQMLGKANIGIIDGVFNRYTTKYRLGLIDEKEFIENYKFLKEENNKAVDGIEVNIDKILSLDSKIDGTSGKELFKNIYDSDGNMLNSSINLVVKTKLGTFEMNTWNDNWDANEPGVIDTIVDIIKRNNKKTNFKKGENKPNKIIIDGTNGNLETQQMAYTLLGGNSSIYKDAIKEVYNFIGKHNYDLGEAKSKNLYEMPNDYSNIEKYLNYFIEYKNDESKLDPFIAHLIDSKSLYKEDFQKMFDNIGEVNNKIFIKNKENYKDGSNLPTELANKVDTTISIYRNIKRIQKSPKEMIKFLSDFNIEKVNLDDKTKKLFEKLKKLDIDGTRKTFDSKSLKRINEIILSLKDNFYSLKENNKDYNFDNYLIQKTKDYNTINKEFINVNYLSALDKDISHDLNFHGIEELKEMPTLRNLGELSNYYLMSTAEFEGKLKQIFGPVDDFMDKIDKGNPVYADLTKNDKNNIVALSALGISPEDISDFYENIISLSPEDRYSFYKSTKNFTINDMKTLMSSLSKEQIKEIGLLKAIEDIGVSEFSKKINSNVKITQEFNKNQIDKLNC